MDGVVIVRRAPNTEITLKRGSTNPATIVNPPAINLVLNQQLGIGPTGGYGPQGPPGPQGPTGEGADDPGDLTLWFDNQLIG